MATIRKRGNSYQVRVSCGYDTQGRQVEQAMTWKIPEGMTERQIEKELQRQVVLFEEACIKGYKSSAVKFSDYCTQWFKEYADLKLKAQTVYKYRYSEKKVSKAIGHLRIDRITPRHIQKLVTDLTETEREDNKNGESKKLSPKTIKNHISFISTVFDHAVKMQVVSTNPCKNVTLPKIEKKEHDIYTLEESQQIIDLLLQEPPESMNLALFFILAIFTGFRRGEILGLQWGDFDFKHNTVSIRRTSNSLPGKGTYTDSTKTKSSNRTLKLSDDVMAVVCRFREQQNEEKAKIGDKWIEHDRLFTAWNGMPMHNNTPHKYFERFCKKSGIRFISTHKWRHFNGTFLIANGVDVKTVQYCLGHTLPSTTLSIYCQAVQESQARAMEVVSNAFSLNIIDSA